MPEPVEYVDADEPEIRIVQISCSSEEGLILLFPHTATTTEGKVRINPIMQPSNISNSDRNKQVNEKAYDRTLIASFNGYITQAVVYNFMPLLFVTFAATLKIDMVRISNLITINFVTQLVVDALAGKYVDRIGYKRCIIAAHVFAAIGLLTLGLVPTHVSDPYAAILVSLVFYAFGGGLIEVMVSPIVEVCPTKHKAKAMSLLHSFYCWGQLATVIISTLFLWFFGINNWPTLSCIWAIVPVIGIVMFATAPMPDIVPEGITAMTAKGPVRQADVLSVLHNDALLRSGRTRHEPVGQRFRRIRIRRTKGHRRSGRASGLRAHDGAQPHNLRHLG